MDVRNRGELVSDAIRHPRVLVISLGGTIASSNADASSGVVTPSLSARDLVEAVTQLDELATVETVGFRQIPSGDLTLGDLVELAALIDVRLAGDVDGVVVTQGTDTIEESAFALDLLVHSSLPVVVTGAMRNPTQAGPDGPANLLAAVRVAASIQARGLGTLVVFNDEIHAARFVRKTHSTSPATFHSPNAGPIGWVVEDRVRIVLRVDRLSTVGPLDGADVAPVALLKCTIGDEGRLLRELVSSGYRGVVIEGFGGGHVPSAMVPAIEALAQQIPVVLASRTGSGELLAKTYGFRGSETDLLSRGVQSAGVLDGLKSRVLLSLAIAASDNASVREATFVRVRDCVAGERDPAALSASD